MKGAGTGSGGGGTSFKDGQEWTHEKGLSSQTDDPVVTSSLRKQERLLLWKMDLQIVTLAGLLYFFSFLDRSNIGLARLNGLQTDLHLSNHDYLVALTVLYVPYIIFEIPSNLLIKKVGPARWLPGLVLAWGIVATLQGVVTTRTGLYVARAFLGASEAGILPGIALYLTMFYRKEELQLRQSLYFSGASLSGAFSGLLSVAIGKMGGTGGKSAWSWIFILYGLATVLFAVLTLFLLPNGPADLWWTSPAEKKLAADRLLRPDFGVTNDDSLSEREGEKALLEERQASEEFRWSEVLAGLTDPSALIIAISGFCNATGLYSASFFSPTIISGIGKYTTTQAQLLSCPPFAAAFVVSIVLGFVADRLRWRFLSCLISYSLAAIGFGIAWGTSSAHGQYAGLVVLTCGAYSAPPATISWVSNLTAGSTKRATSIALMIVFTNSGGVCANWLWDGGPRYRKGFLVNLILNIAGICLLAVLELLLLYERRARRQGKRDHRVQELREQGRSDAWIRGHLGDRHPSFALML